MDIIAGFPQAVELVQIQAPQLVHLWWKGTHEDLYEQNHWNFHDDRNKIESLGWKYESSEVERKRDSEFVLRRGAAAGLS